MCDQIKFHDCPNGWDESNGCTINECLNSTLCDHSCKDLKIGYQCMCNHGYELSEDQHTCEGMLTLIWMVSLSPNSQGKTLIDTILLI